MDTSKASESPSPESKRSTRIAAFSGIDCQVSPENGVQSNMGHFSASPSVDLPVPPFRFLRFPAVRARTGLSRSTIWRLERQGAFRGTAGFPGMR